jgi:hypothetical protein
MDAVDTSTDNLPSAIPESSQNNINKKRKRKRNDQSAETDNAEPKLVVVSKPIHTEHICPFRFTFNWHKQGQYWYMRPGQGCREHRFHDKLTVDHQEDDEDEAPVDLPT